MPSRNSACSSVDYFSVSASGRALRLTTQSEGIRCRALFGGGAPAVRDWKPAATPARNSPVTFFPCRDGETGRRSGLKIRRPERVVGVRVPLPAPSKPGNAALADAGSSHGIRKADRRDNYPAPSQTEHSTRRQKNVVLNCSCRWRAWFISVWNSGSPRRLCNRGSRMK